MSFDSSLCTINTSYFHFDLRMLKEKTRLSKEFLHLVLLLQYLIYCYTHSTMLEQGNKSLQYVGYLYPNIITIRKVILMVLDENKIFFTD